MNLRELAHIVSDAIIRDPPEALAAFCAEQIRPYYHLLYLLGRYFAGEGIAVELGVEKGRASFGLCLGGIETWGFDHTRREEIAVLEDAFPHFHYHERPSLPPPGNVKRDVRVLHVDTEHSHAMAREEFWAWKQYLKPPAVVCFDDTHAQESGVGHFVSTLVWPTILDDRLHECGYAVMLYTGG